VRATAVKVDRWFTFFYDAGETNIRDLVTEETPDA